MIIDNCRINCNIEISEAEARSYCKLEKKARPAMTLIALDIKVDGDEVILTPHYDTIVRVRRITGYLSNVKNFNAAKKSEQSDRVKHF